MSSEGHDNQPLHTKTGEDAFPVPASQVDRDSAGADVSAPSLRPSPEPELPDDYTGEHESDTSSPDDVPDGSLQEGDDSTDHAFARQDRRSLPESQRPSPYGLPVATRHAWSKAWSREVMRLGRLRQSQWEAKDQSTMTWTMVRDECMKKFGARFNLSRYACQAHYSHHSKTEPDAYEDYVERLPDDPKPRLSVEQKGHILRLVKARLDTHVQVSWREVVAGCIGEFGEEFKADGKQCARFYKNQKKRKGPP